MNNSWHCTGLLLASLVAPQALYVRCKFCFTPGGASKLTWTVHSTRCQTTLFESAESPVIGCSRELVVLGSEEGYQHNWRKSGN